MRAGKLAIVITVFKNYLSPDNFTAIVVQQLPIIFRLSRMNCYHSLHEKLSKIFRPEFLKTIREKIIFESQGRTEARYLMKIFRLSRINCYHSLHGKLSKILRPEFLKTIREKIIFRQIIFSVRRIKIEISVL